jgi:hypothetical protein
MYYRYKKALAGWRLSSANHLCIFSYVNANLHCLFTLPPLGSALQAFDLHKRLGPSILAILLLTLPQLLLVYDGNKSLYLVFVGMVFLSILDCF